MLSLNLTPIFKARGIEKPYTFLVKAGFSHYTASTIINSKPKALRLGHIELLCTALLCEPNDLFLWTPDKNKVYAENFPLLKFKTSGSANNWKETLAHMPFNELKEATKHITDKPEEE